MSFNAAQPASQTGGVSAAGDYMDISMLPVENKESSTLLWQQQQYLTDSGINSAMETHTPSVCSSRHGQEDMEHECASVLSGQGATHPHGGPPPPPPPPQHQQWYSSAGGPSTAGPPGPHPPSSQPNQQQQSQTQLSIRPQPPPQPQDVCMLSPGTPLGPPSACPASISAGGGESMADFGTAAVPVSGAGGASGQVMESQQPLTLQNLGLQVPANQMDDSDMAASAIPDLCRLIQDEDQVIVQQAAIMVFQLSREVNTREALYSSWDMMGGLVSALDSVEDVDTSRCLAGTLYNVSQCPAGLKMIYQSGAIPGLVKLLDSSMESIQFYAITTLHNLLLHQEGAKPALRAAGGLPVMVGLLKKNNVKFLAICTDCLQILAYGHQESKNVILACGGPAELVRIMRVYSYEKLLWTSTRVLKVLSVCPKNKPAIIEANGMQALAGHLHHQSQRLVHNCLWTLRNLSDAATFLDNQDDLMRSLVQLLTSNDVNMVTCAAGILSNLTCNNQNNKLNVFRFGGIEALLRALSQAGDKEEILEPCVCALRHLTSRHEGAEAAQNAIRVHNGLSVLAQVMTPSPQCPPRSWALCKAMVGLLRNLTLCTGNSAALRENGLVLKLINIVTRANQEIHRHLSVSPANPCAPVVVQGVRMQDVLEGSCAALHIVARDPPTRALLRHSPHIHLFIQLLYSPTEAIQRVAAAVICELTQDREGAEVLEREGGPATQQRLSEMAHSLNEGLATYATAIVLRMSEMREERQQALNTPPNPVAAGAPMQHWMQPPGQHGMSIPQPNHQNVHPHHSQPMPPHHHLQPPPQASQPPQAPPPNDPFLELPPGGGGSMLNYLQQGTPPQGPPGPPPQQHPVVSGRPPNRSMDSSGYVSPAGGYAPHYGGPVGPPTSVGPPPANDPSMQAPPWIYENPPAHM